MRERISLPARKRFFSRAGGSGYFGGALSLKGVIDHYQGEQTGGKKGRYSGEAQKGASFTKLTEGMRAFVAD